MAVLCADRFLFARIFARAPSSDETPSPLDSRLHGAFQVNFPSSGNFTPPASTFFLPGPLIVRLPETPFFVEISLRSPGVSSTPQFFLLPILFPPAGCKPWLQVVSISFPPFLMGPSKIFVRCGLVPFFTSSFVRSSKVSFFFFVTGSNWSLRRSGATPGSFFSPL